MENKIISIKKYQKNKKKELKMLLLIILFSLISAILVWNFYVEKKSHLDIEIPQSQNIFYNNQKPIASTTAQISSEFEQSDSRPILLYLYTSWCGVCKKNFPIINEVAREFQNTELKVVSIAIDRDMTDEKLAQYLNSLGNFYFEPRFLAFKEGFVEFLAQKDINYRGVIPFTALISRDGKVVMKYNGVKKLHYLRSKIIQEMYK